MAVICEDSGIKGVEEIQVGAKQVKVINSYWASERPVREGGDKRGSSFDGTLDGRTTMPQGGINGVPQLYAYSGNKEMI